MKQMLNNKIFKIVLVMGAYYLISSSGFCAEEIAQNPAVKQGFHGSVIKFLYAMGGVILSSLIIFGGLTVYNKLFVKTIPAAKEENNSFKTPASVHDAILFFINRNKIK